jgi:hypothetical protein
MSDTLDGFPFWTLEFQKDGTPTNPSALDAFVAEAGDSGLTDLFVFSHGWNNDRAAALSLYERFFAEVAKLTQGNGAVLKNPAARLGVAGVVWPSILWPDDAPSEGDAPVLPPPEGGGAVALPAAAAGVPAKTAEPAEIRAVLETVYLGSDQRRLIAELTAMLEAREHTNAAIAAFKDTLGELLASEPAMDTDKRQPDAAEGAMAELGDADWHELLEQLGDGAVERGAAVQGGSVGLGDAFKKMWDGAKDALRIGTYWQMKNRAGIVGRQGLGPLLARLARDVPGLRVHLLGHSFGARLVSYSLAGLPPEQTGTSSPVKSLFLLQGAFSHYAFADALPQDGTRSGALKGMAARVDGPLLTTQSLRDYAVGVSYPAASIVNGDDASDFTETSNRWGAMGHDGAQAVSAMPATLAPPGAAYPFAKGKWVNLDGNDVIIHGQLPSGAHSDIVHPHTAWAALGAAGLV